MTLYEMIKKYGTGKGEDMMWKTLRVISDHIDDSMDDEHVQHLMRDLYGEMSDGHYNQEYAEEDVKKMYYTDDNGKRHYAPYWSEEQSKTVYESVKRSLPGEYNCWDFYVALNMVKSDNCPILRKWFPNLQENELEAKVIELAISWLNDDDNPYGTEKVWGYLNGNR